MNRGRKLELVCVLCNEALADLEKACAGLCSSRNDPNNNRAPDPYYYEVNENSAYGSKGANYQHYGGYHSVSTENQKEVVATKCGHMFHQGCLRKHVHKTLIEGKGGALFCPICTRPFQMNRLWPVVIPPTKAQRERYLQLKMMKEQNADMVQQLKQIRAKIAEEEAHLNKLKEDAEQCLCDIQQKQKLLDSVNGPTTKEMMELTKIHAKRQEILHVVTQHNADLLKLLAEESNISSTTAENILGNKANDDLSFDYNQNYVPPGTASSESRSRSRSRAYGDVGVCSIPSPSRISLASPRRSKSRKKVKSHHRKRTSNKKSRKHKSKHKQYGGPKLDASQILKFSPSIPDPVPKLPSKLIPSEEVVSFKQKPARSRSTRKGTCGTADTLAKWNIESLKELMALPPSFQNMNNIPCEKESLLHEVPPPPPQFDTREQTHDRQYVSQNYVALAKEMANAKDSLHLLLSRKPPMYESAGRNN